MSINEIGYIIICSLIIVGGSGLIIMYMHGISRIYKYKEEREKRNERRDKENRK